MSAKVKTGEEPPSVDSKSSANKSGDDASASKRSSNKSSSKGSSSSRSSSKSSSSSRSSGSGSDKGSSRSGSSSKQKKLKKVKVKKTKSGSGSRSSSHSGSDSGVSASGSKKKPEDDKESKVSQDDEQSPDKKSDAKENFFAQNRKEMKDDGRSMNLDGLMAKLEEVAKNLKNAKSSLADEGDGLWKDEDFPPINKSLAKDDDKLKEIKAPYKSNIKWMRPQTISKDVKFAVTEFSKCDLKFGQTSDAVFTSALGLLAIHANIENIFVDVENIFTMGYAVFQFFKNGEWRYVIVDTFIPYSPEKKTTLYSECGEPNECWVQLVEKAYAKLNGCYQNIQGMDICEVLVDLTGGVADKEEIDSEKYKEAKDAKDSTETAVLYSRIKSFISNKYILGCIKHVPSRHASAKENGDRGIYENLYYGMLGIWEFSQGSDEPRRLMKLRNYWGVEGNWNGDWCNNHEDWDRNPEIRKALLPDQKNKIKDDHIQFFMKLTDWAREFNCWYICKVFNDSWQKYSIPGEWAGKSAGGRKTVFTKLIPT